MMASRLRAVLALVAISLLSGCATLTTSSSQTVTMTTEPPGAACTFKREGQVIGVVNPTPGSLSVSKSHTAIDVLCSKEGFLDATGSVGSRFQAMTFGNILFGGIIGIAVDAASGATAEYEPTITIRLTPSEFADAAARDRFFDEQRNRKVIAALRQRGVSWPEAAPAPAAGEGRLSGETVVITGTLASMTRDEARQAARAAGATVTDSVSKKTTLLVVGAEAGSKLRKAQELGVTIVDEDQFRRRLGLPG